MPNLDTKEEIVVTPEEIAAFRLNRPNWAHWTDDQVVIYLKDYKLHKASQARLKARIA